MSGGFTHRSADEPAINLADTFDRDFDQFFDSYLSQLANPDPNGALGALANPQPAFSGSTRGENLLQPVSPPLQTNNYSHPLASLSGLPAYNVQNLPVSLAQDYPSNPAFGASASATSSQHHERPTSHQAVEANKRSRLEALEKNRRAQKRFRERQKEKMSTLEQQVKDMSTELERLQTENDALLSRNAILEKVLSIREEQIAALQDAAKVFARGPETESSIVSDNLKQILQSTMEHKSFSTEEVMNMKLPDLCVMWKNHIKEIASYLMMLDSPNCPDGVIDKVVDLAKGAVLLCCKCAMVNPMTTKALVASNLELQRLQGQHSQQLETHWTTVLRAVGFDRDQKQQLIAVRASFLKQLEDLVAERRSINMELQLSVPPATANRDITSASLRAHRALGRLKENLRKEHQIHLEFMVSVFSKVMTNMQFAKMAVHSYPYFPDALAVANVLAGDTDTDEGVDSASGTTSAHSKGHGRSSNLCVVSATQHGTKEEDMMLASDATMC